MPSYSLIKATPPHPRGIECQFFLVEPAQAGRRRILVVSISGEYPDGSLGNAHGAYMASMALHGIHALDADGLILDLRGLAYRWGNTLLKVFQDVSQFKDAGAEPNEPRFPVAVVTSEKCRSAFLSLVTPTDQAPPEWHFDDMDQAIECSLKKVEEWFAYV
ncbi:hypothetical protein [Methylibium rhizosphaerae]|uniref:hypothetical protein n=1 Tax=Methylibium rhizosphaerae TaxID=2570323 RepID=UPI00112943F4|nr:hypothetical protein [Methylibium rhizosphaerae]